MGEDAEINNAAFSRAAERCQDFVTVSAFERADFVVRPQAQPQPPPGAQPERVSCGSNGPRFPSG